MRTRSAAVRAVYRLFHALAQRSSGLRWLQAMMLHREAWEALSVVAR